MNTVQRHSGISICDFGAASKGFYLLTYLLTYLLAYLPTYLLNISSKFAGKMPVAEQTICVLKIIRLRVALLASRLEIVLNQSINYSQHKGPTSLKLSVVRPLRKSHKYKYQNNKITAKWHSYSLYSDPKLNEPLALILITLVDEYIRTTTAVTA